MIDPSRTNTRVGAELYSVLKHGFLQAIYSSRMVPNYLRLLHVKCFFFFKSNIYIFYLEFRCIDCARITFTMPYERYMDTVLFYFFYSSLKSNNVFRRVVLCSLLATLYCSYYLITAGNLTISMLSLSLPLSRLLSFYLIVCGRY